LLLLLLLLLQLHMALHSPHLVLGVANMFA